VTSPIGTLREGPLHAAIKDWLARPGDRTEVKVGRFAIDLVRAGGELVEVQTGGFGPLGRKLDALLDDHSMRVVFPVPARRRIVRIDEHGEIVSSRMSAKRGTPLELFDRLVSWPTLVAHPNLTLEVLLCDEDHVRGPEAGRSRTGRRTRDPGVRQLNEVLGSVTVADRCDALALLPAGSFAEPVTTRELAAQLKVGRVLAARIIYCLRAMELVEQTGRSARAPAYSRVA